MLWIKAFHIIAITAWFAGLFYLPRLFVYHAAIQPDDAGYHRFCQMEQRLYTYIMLPAALLSTALGLWLLYGYAWSAYRHQGWLHTKLLLVILLWGYHFHCGALARRFRNHTARHSVLFYRLFNEIPTLLLVSIVILVTVKPF
jgi:putative membrane protein